MTDEEKGERLAGMLGLKKNRKGRYPTTWGDKTAEGLYKCIIRVVFGADDLQQQRHDLLATLKDLLAVVCPEYDGDYPYPLRDKIQQAEQAIANAEK